jgi:hypothetical protein
MPGGVPVPRSPSVPAVPACATIGGPESRPAARTFGSAGFAIMADGAVPGADIAAITADPAAAERLRAGHAIALACSSPEVGVAVRPAAW